MGNKKQNAYGRLLVYECKWSSINSILNLVAFPVAIETCTYVSIEDIQIKAIMFYQN